MISSSFVCEFIDKQVTRMTVHGKPQKPDLKRGIKLALFAYESRCKKQAPAMVAARFEHNGATLAHYGADELAKVRSKMQEGPQ
jgi:hypothetical protein